LRARAIAVGKVVLMIAPLVWISQRVKWAAVADRALHFGLLTFLAAASLLALTVVVNGCRWHALLRAHDASPLPTRRSLIWQSFVALYLNQLPGGVAGDVVRAHRVRTSVDGMVTSLTVLLLERVCGLVALFAMATVGALAMPTHGATRLAAYLQVSACVTSAIAIVAVGLPWVATRVRLERTVFARISIVSSVLSRLRPPKRLAPLTVALSLSFVIHSLTITVIVAFVPAMAPSAPLGAVVAVTPLAILLTFIPLTPGGFGQREAIFVELYGLAGVSPDEAVAASLLWFSSSFASLVIGLVLASIERVRGDRSSP
jgi:uncharacterized protein (TIRG00374 family)